LDDAVEKIRKNAMEMFVLGIRTFCTTRYQDAYASMRFLQRNINFVRVMSIYRKLDSDYSYIVHPLGMSLNFKDFAIFILKVVTFQEYPTYCIFLDSFENYEIKPDSEKGLT